MNKARSQPNIPLLEVDKLSLSYLKQKNAVNRVSFTLYAGRILGLVGASGAGKSSVARAILRLLEADAGNVRFNGENIFDMSKTQLKDMRRRIQIVFQEPSASLSPRRTIEQTLLEPLNHFAIGDSASRLQKIRQTLQTVGLDSGILQRYPHQFSTGQQQRIAIARALVTNPDLLIADEAVSALDVSVQAQILQLIRTLQKDHGIAFLFISHDLAVIRQIADEVAVMYRGQLLEHCSADRFFNHAAHPYSKALLSYADFTTTPGPEDRGSAACIYAGLCAERMSLCEQTEPEYYKIQDREELQCVNWQCVKCHLYREAAENDN